MRPFTDLKGYKKGEPHMSQRYLIPEEAAKRKQRKKNMLLAGFCIIVVALGALLPFLASKL